MKLTKNTPINVCDETIKNTQSNIYINSNTGKPFLVKTYQ